MRPASQTTAFRETTLVFSLFTKWLLHPYSNGCGESCVPGGELHVNDLDAGHNLRRFVDLPTLGSAAGNGSVSWVALRQQHPAYTCAFAHKKSGCMELSGSPSDLALLRRFSPFDAMKPENLTALAKRTSRLQAPKGRLLFTEGEEPARTCAAAPVLGSGHFRPHRIPVPRQRVSRCRGHVGPDRQLQGHRAARPDGRGRPGRRRLDDGAAADQGVPQGSAGEHPG